EADLARLIYQSELLPEEERSIPVRLLAGLRPPPGDCSLSIVERHVEGAFELLILYLPWKATGKGTGYHPLLISREPDVRIIGFVLPWNEIISRLPPGAGALGSLSATWIMWTMRAQAAH